MAVEAEFVDTNIFLRYITDDIPEQADAAEDLFRQAASGEDTLITSVATIAEVVWVLESFYAYPRPAIKHEVKGIIGTPGLEVEHQEQVLQAVVWYEEYNVDFIDAYNAAWMLTRELEVIHTFDEKHFKRFEHLTVRVPGSS